MCFLQFENVMKVVFNLKQNDGEKKLKCGN